MFHFILLHFIFVETSCQHKKEKPTGGRILSPECVRPSALSVFNLGYRTNLEEWFSFNIFYGNALYDTS